MPREVFIELKIPKRERAKFKSWLEAHDKIDFAPYWNGEKIILFNYTKKEAIVNSKANP